MQHALTRAADATELDPQPQFLDLVRKASHEALCQRFLPSNNSAQFSRRYADNARSQFSYRITMIDFRKQRGFSEAVARAGGKKGYATTVRCVTDHCKPALLDHVNCDRMISLAKQG